MAQPTTSTESSHVQHRLSDQRQLLEFQGGGHVSNMHLRGVQTMSSLLAHQFKQRWETTLYRACLLLSYRLGVLFAIHCQQPVLAVGMEEELGAGE